MKKLSILLIGLLLITGFAVAQEFDGSVSVTGDASVTWGVDLDTNATGFLNAGTSSITITLVKKQTVSAGGEDDLYGWIQIKDVEIKATNAALSGSGGTVSAKIVVSPIEILIYAAPGMSWGNADALETGDPDIAPALTGANTIGGITIVLPFDPANIKVYFVSDGDWTTNAANDYAAGVDVTLEISIITVDLGAFYGWFNAAGTWGATVAFGVALDALNGVDISVGVDLVDPGDWEVAFGTVVNLTEANADDDMGNVSLDVFYSTGADLDVVLGITEPTAGGFVDMVGAGVTVELFDLLSGTIVWNLDVTGEYSSGGLKPYFGFGVGSDNVIDINAGIELGADLTGIDNTTVTLDYATTDINVSNGVITAEVAVSY